MYDVTSIGFIFLLYIYSPIRANWRIDGADIKRLFHLPFATRGQNTEKLQIIRSGIFDVLFAFGGITIACPAHTFVDSSPMCILPSFQNIIDFGGFECMRCCTLPDFHRGVCQTVAKLHREFSPRVQKVRGVLVLSPATNATQFLRSLIIIFVSLGLFSYF